MARGPQMSFQQSAQRFNAHGVVTGNAELRSTAGIFAACHATIAFHVLT